MGESPDFLQEAGHPLVHGPAEMAAYEGSDSRDVEDSNGLVPAFPRPGVERDFAPVDPRDVEAQLRP
ncbi:hypothetical protein ACFUOZ_16650 [Paenarthrobacter sp. NPDC057355]|uniref:hypothetical protein n=1 Tax=Paenarthrobacter sp. NPDC057355 TaxID=3346105 RepID=UPI00362CB972